MAKSKISQENIEKLPTSTLGILCMHLQGINLKYKLSAPTYYKYKPLLEAYGYDISKPLT
mgnify:CR=1 FL=1